MLAEQNSMLTKLFYLTATQANTTGYSINTNLKLLEGAWISVQNDHAYCRIIQERPYFVYCYKENNEATGEYYDFRPIGNDILCRFRWFKSDIRGFAWLKVENATLLTGAWWMEEDVPALAHNDPELLKQSKGMNAYTWIKQATATFPSWATAVLDRVK